MSWWPGACFSQVGYLSPHIMARAASVSTASRALPGPTALGDCGPFFPGDGVLSAKRPAVTICGNRVMPRHGGHSQLTSLDSRSGPHARVDWVRSRVGTTPSESELHVPTELPATGLKWWHFGPADRGHACSRAPRPLGEAGQLGCCSCALASSCRTAD